MRKCIALILTLALSLALLAAPALAESEDAIIAALETALADHLPLDEYAYSLDVSTTVGTVDLHFNALDEITDYGAYIYYLMEAVADIYPDAQKVEFTLSDGKLENSRFLVFESYLWKSSSHYGDLTDYRSGFPVSHEIETLDDLIALFPAMAADGIGSGIDQADLDLFNEVMAILESDYSRSEAEIIEEIAPDYGMTPDELYQFLNTMLEQLYT